MDIHPNSTCNDCFHPDCGKKYYVGFCSHKVELTVKEKLISQLLKSEKIKRSYKVYIVKTIPFEKWVRDMVDRHLEIVDDT